VYKGLGGSKIFKITSSSSKVAISTCIGPFIPRTTPHDERQKGILALKKIYKSITKMDAEFLEIKHFIDVF
jgi:hypothetical protein